MNTVSTIFGKTVKPSENEGIEVPVFEGYDVLDDGDLIALQESYEDQLSIVKQIHQIDTEMLLMESDINALQENEDVSEYEIEQREEAAEVVVEASVKGAWESIKQFFRNLAGKLKAFFDSVVRYFDGLFRSSAGFVSKYESQLSKLNLAGYKFKMHDYTHLEEPAKDATVMDAKGVKDLYHMVFDRTIAASPEGIERLKRQIESSRGEKEELLNGVRGDVLGGGPVTPDKFKHQLFSYFRGGAKSHDDRAEKAVEIRKIIASIKNTSAKAKIQAAEKATNDEFNDILKKIDALSKSVENSSGFKSNDGENMHRADAPSPTAGATTRRVNYNVNNRTVIVEGVRMLATFTTGIKDINMAFFREWRAAWAERDSAYKSICRGAFSYKAK